MLLGTDSTTPAWRVAVAGAIGTAIEWYDFFIYGTAAAVVFGPQYFPQVSEQAGMLAAFATFGVGFLARPLGGVVMGHFGDRRGRRAMLVWSLLLMGVATFAIGLLPAYAQIGIWAPLLLTLCRFTQGFALGGEWGGAVLMSVEHAPDHRRGLFGSLVALGLPVGIILSNLVFLVATLYSTPEEFAASGWRFPFLASGVLVIVGAFVRLRITESPVFRAAQAAGGPPRHPVLDVLRHHTRTVLLAAGSYIGVGALGYLTIVFVVSYATRELRLSLSTTLILLMTTAATMAISIVVCAYLSDRMGRTRIMRAGVGGQALWSFALFPLLDTGSVPLIALALSGVFLLQGAYIGTQPAVFAELFPTSMRYSGASLALTLGTILGGAPAPFVATYLFGVSGDSRLITAYVVGVSLFSLLCVLGLRETYRERLH